MTKYPSSGPFVNGQAPGISASFLNSIEQYLGYAADSNITTDGNGNLTLPSVKVTTVLRLLTGTLTRVSFFSGSGGGTFNHGLGVTPNIILLVYAGNFGSPPGQPLYYYGENTTQVTVSASSSYAWKALAIAL